jgi:hypothetical protein
MSEYETVRHEFHDLQNAERLTEVRLAARQIIQGGMVLPPDPGFNGVCTYKREDGSLICQEAFLGGAVDGYARYFNRKGELVGEDDYEQGGVTQTRVFK